jgi:nucleotide-binding universal stress UspA family protein
MSIGGVRRCRDGNCARRARLPLDVAQSAGRLFRKTRKPDTVRNEANMYRTILVPIDGAPTSDRACREAVSIARGFGATLRFVHIVDPRRLFAEVTSTIGAQQVSDAWRAAGERLLARALADATAAGVSAEAVLRCDPGRRVGDEILAEARRCEADLIVMGSHGRSGPGGCWLGSDAEHVLKLSALPVLTVGEPHAEGAVATRAVGGAARRSA